MDSPLAGFDFQDLLLRKLAQLSRRNQASAVDSEDTIPTTLEGVMPELQARAMRRAARMKDKLDSYYPL